MAKTVEVRESEIRDDGLDVVRRAHKNAFGYQDEYPAHIPDKYREQLLRELAQHVDGCKVVSSEEAELLREFEETLCD
jgi:hypothetical protein